MSLPFIVYHCRVKRRQAESGVCTQAQRNSYLIIAKTIFLLVPRFIFVLSFLFILSFLFYFLNVCVFTVNRVNMYDVLLDDGIPQLSSL